MIYDLPLHYNADFVKFAIENVSKIYSVYFTLSTYYHSDARIQNNEKSFEEKKIILQQLPKSIKKYITINGRYTPVDFFDSAKMKIFCSALRDLLEEGLLDGLIYLDFYFLQRIAEIDSDLASKLEAVPSVNCFLDSMDKINSQLVYIKDIGFKKPAKIIVDRSINRRMDDLEYLRKKFLKTHPDMKMELLVNEGCLYQCPYKVNHDIAISLVNDKTVAGQVYLNNKVNQSDYGFDRLNENHGCLNYLETRPNRLFEMPFIRPEDIHHYTELADIFKISGKMKTTPILVRIFEAYETGIWDSNLLELLDAARAMSDKYYIMNDEIPENFHTMLTTCDKNCSACKFCEKLAAKVIQKIKK